MSREEIQSIVNIGNIHEKRLLEAYSEVKHLFPMNAEKVINISKVDFFALETLNSRFSRLQDLMGSKLFDLCLNSLGETTDGLSMIDKANKLEKTGILSTTHAWMELRRLRNSLTHEYPDQPEITADILNKLDAAIKPMLELYHKMSDAIKRGSNI